MLHIRLAAQRPPNGTGGNERPRWHMLSDSTCSKAQPHATGSDENGYLQL
jgi:hypothetical protein